MKCSSSIKYVFDGVVKCQFFEQKIHEPEVLFISSQVNKKRSGFMPDLYLLVVDSLRIHRRQDKLFKILGDRNQGIIDHNILRIDSINMIYIHNVGFMCTIEFIAR